MKIYIKYMVSLRCKLIVKQELEKLGLQHSDIELGSVRINEPMSDEVRNTLHTRLETYGLILLDDQKSIIIEKIKNTVIEMIHYSDEPVLANYSDYISQKLGYDYTYLANTFSKVEGITIKHFIIIHKVERIKELLLYNEMNLTEISYLLNYSSVAHLSNQFKKITGLTPSFYKNMKKQRKKNLEDI